MKVLFKTVTGKQSEVEVEASATVLEVKKNFEEDYEPSSLRLVFNGAVLEDAKTMADAGVKEGDAVVLAGRKRKIPKPAPHPPAEAPKAEAPTTAESNAAPASSAPAMMQGSAKPSSLVDITTPSEAAPATTTTTTTAAAAEPPTAPAPAASFLAPAAPSATTAPVAQAPVAPSIPESHGAPANLIDEVCSMGFEDRQQVALALRAAYMNVDRAVEYLFDGIPPHRIQELTRDNAPPAPAPAPTAGAAAPSAPPTAATAPSTAAPAPATPESELRAALAGIPQFDQIRALYAQNTETLPVVTEQIALRHPAVYELIERHPEAFLAIMSESGSPASTASAPSQSGGAPSLAHAMAPAGAEGAEGAEGFMNRLPGELELTPADRVAVQQLVELGGGMWDEQSALLVYLATQRNQEVAASILFEHGGVPPELLAEIANQMAEEDIYEDEGEEQ